MYNRPHLYGASSGKRKSPFLSMETIIEALLSQPCGNSETDISISFKWNGDNSEGYSARVA